MIKQRFKINGRNEIPFVGSVREREETQRVSKQQDSTTETHIYER